VTKRHLMKAAARNLSTIMRAISDGNAAGQSTLAV
jgi:hypothetical protein